ncbi:hypothetical protein Fmac_021677 [Flemingia macrophylla]|uniref:Uncharacterized protein n=1 Tax=Flemingia macrophylla TaxID=520843 RepID=A0ABD1LZC8_9FABA
MVRSNGHNSITRNFESSHHMSFVVDVHFHSIEFARNMSTTLVRNGTLTFSRRYRYEVLGLQGKEKMVKSISYRRKRAKQRKIFLTTYKLSSLDNTFVHPQRPKLKKVAVKVKKIVASVLMFMRTGSFRSCSSTSAISATSPSLPNNRNNF